MMIKFKSQKFSSWILENLEQEIVDLGADGVVTRTFRLVRYDRSRAERAQIYGRSIWFRISPACSCQRIISPVRVPTIYKESLSGPMSRALSSRAFLSRENSLVDFRI